ncbi:hypothetical protein CVT24_003993 [Panaeolus cyanescens]|uniref:Uncharacterized protein n=1 Tax=Panaeolus cyanescens TaxID=181874 RepID=A0A409Y638_9AGAR|nr:hypothetical protein CVT24_003993 [Panaeolus cyanescens]
MVLSDVTEGYRTTPSSFSRAQTTGTIFRSMNDTMRDVYTNNPSSADTQVGDSRVLKRSRSFEANSEPQTNASDDASTQPEDKNAPRLIRPLRTSSRTFLTTQSMPAGSFSMGFNKDNGVSNGNERVTSTIEEDDWSGENTTQTQAFQPMVLE